MQSYSLDGGRQAKAEPLMGLGDRVIRTRRFSVQPYLARAFFPVAISLSPISGLV